MDETPLCHAARFVRPDDDGDHDKEGGQEALKAVRFLVRHGAHVNAVENGEGRYFPSV